MFLNMSTAMYVVSDLASRAVRGTPNHNTVVLLCSAAETVSYLYFLSVFLDAADPEEREGA